MAETAERVVLIAVDASGQAQQAYTYYMEALHRPENYVSIKHMIPAYCQYIHDFFVDIMW